MTAERIAFAYAISIVPAIFIETCMTNAEIAIESPCNRVCVMHPAAQLCIGCGRTLGEIGRWSELGAAERSGIMAQLGSRLAALRAGNVAPAATHEAD
jgi:predicted Fe-S protein YdhL (DUF1289 family)